MVYCPYWIYMKDTTLFLRNFEAEYSKLRNYEMEHS